MAVKPLCSVPKCCNHLYAKRLCRPHYMRFRSHGDFCLDATKPGEALAYFENVVLPFRGLGCLTWPFAKTKRGYAKVTKDGKLQYVYRLACEVMNGPPPTPKHQAAHSCGKGHEGCVNPLHVSWKTRRANESDKLTHGTVGRGELCGTSKLTDDQVRQIRALKGSETQEEIASRFGVKREAISKIHRRETWFHI